MTKKIRLFPRHRAVLDSILRLTMYHGGSCCENVLQQHSGVVRINSVTKDLERMGLIRYKRAYWTKCRPSGWCLTDKGKDLWREMTK